MAQFLISTTGVVTLSDLGNRILPSGLSSVDIGTEFGIEELRYSADLASAIEAGTLSVVDDGRGRSITGPVSNAIATAFVNDIFHFDDADVTAVIGSTDIADLNDTTIGSLSNGEVLTWNGSAWVNLAGGGGAVDSVNGATGVVVLDTDDLLEGTNKYYATSLFNADLATKDTDDLTEGSTNLYWTAARFNAAISAADTDDLTEGSVNLYHTDARARAAISVAAGSANYLGYNSGTGELSITALAITSVDVHGTYTSFAAFITGEYTGSEFQEGDVVILPDVTGGTETYIHNGGTANDGTDFTLMQQPNIDQTTVRGWFSGVAPISYNSGTGAFSLALKANGGLVIESNELALDLGATSITGILGETDGGTGTDTYVKGDILFADDANSLDKLAIGTANDVLQVSATGTPEWVALSPKSTWTWGAGRNNNNATNQYLRSFNGVPGNLSTYVAWFDCELRAISIMTNGAETWTGEVHVNGSSVATLASGGAAKAQSTGLSVSISAGDEVSFYCNGTNINRPVISALFEEV